jgi:hypothetical protein
MMRIKGARTIEEYRQMQREHVQRWIDQNFVEGSVAWEFDGSLNVRVTDKTGDSMIVPLQDIN